MLLATGSKGVADIPILVSWLDMTRWLLRCLCVSRWPLAKLANCGAPTYAGRRGPGSRRPCMHVHVQCQCHHCSPHLCDLEHTKLKRKKVDCGPVWTAERTVSASTAQCRRKVGIDRHTLPSAASAAPDLWIQETTRHLPAMSDSK